MKKMLFSIGFLALLQSCEPEIVCTNTCENKRIRNIDDNGLYSSIEYDDENRQVYFKTALDTLIEYSYSSGSGMINNKLLQTSFTTDDEILPDAELVVSSSTTGENIGGLITAPVERTYTYDAAGRVLNLVEKQGKLLVTSTYTWLTGNLTKIVTTRNAGTPLSKTTTFTYFTDVRNSISAEFQGLKIYGLTSYNAPKTMTITATGLPTTTTIFVYNTDDCGCITHATVSGASTASREYYYEKTGE
jgi:hypothetical protein